MNTETKKLPEISTAPIARNPVTSSQIAAIGYHPESKTLAVEFPSRGDKPGSVYHYGGVPQEVYDGFVAAESKGVYFGSTIKPHPGLYPYRRIS